MFTIEILSPCYNWTFRAPEEGAPHEMRLSPEVSFSGKLLKTLAGCVMHSCEAIIKMERSLPIAIVHFDGKGGATINAQSKEWSVSGVPEFAAVFSTVLRSASSLDATKQTIGFFLDRYYSSEELSKLSDRSFCGRPELTISEFADAVNAYIASCEAMRDGQPLIQQVATPAVLQHFEQLEA